MGTVVGGRRGVENRSEGGGIRIFAPGRGKELCATGGVEGGDRTQKVAKKSPPKKIVGKKIFHIFFFTKPGIFKTIFLHFYLDSGKKILGTSKGCL